jgi:tetrapyrrole methylase family protein/MazG family protein
MPSGVIIVGLGPGDRSYWTLEADQILSTATEVYLRTVHHPSTAAIVARTHSFDSWYEANGDLEKTHHRIAAEIVKLGQRPAGVIYAVPGHPAIGQATVSRVQTLAATSELPVRMVAGLSPIEPALTALGIDRPSQLQIADATEIAANHHPALEPDRPALITMLHGQPLAARIKRTLLNAYSDKLVVTLIQAAGTDLARTISCQLGSLDGQVQLNDQLTMLYLPADIRQGGFSTLQGLPLGS